MLDKQADSRRETESRLMKLINDTVSDQQSLENPSYKISKYLPIILCIGNLRAQIANESKTRFESIDQLKFNEDFIHDYGELDYNDNELIPKR